MARPVVSAAAEEMYEALGPWTREDEANDWHLLIWCEATMQYLQVLEDIVRDTDTTQGWSRILDPEVSPVWALPWLAQFVGVEFEEGLTEDQMRTKLAETAGWKRGTVAALEGAAKVWLTGSKTVTVTERVGGNAYQIEVRTFLGETIDPVRLEAAVRAQKPAGLVLTYVGAGATWADVDPTLTWATIDPTLTWEEAALLMPGDI